MAQTPYEFFEIYSIDPPFSSPEYSVSIPRMPSSLYLDTQTQKAGDLKLTDPFAPPVGTLIRRTVFSKIIHDSEQHFRIVPDESSCRPYRYNTPSPDLTFHRSALLYLDISPDEMIDIPSDSPEMQILAFQSERIDGEANSSLMLYQCPDDRFAVKGTVQGRFRIAYETVTKPDSTKPKPASFFAGIKQDAPRQIHPKDLLVIRDIVKHHPKLKKIMETPDPLPELIQFFQSFKSESLETQFEASPSSWAGKQILSEEKGLCRHRVFLFMIIAQAWGYQVRIAANETHAFAEVNKDDRWYPLELGGNARSLTIQSTNPTRPKRYFSDMSFLDTETLDDGKLPQKPGSNQESNQNTPQAAPDRNVHHEMPSRQPFSTDFSVPPEPKAPVYEFISQEPFTSRMTRNKAIVIKGQMVGDRKQPLSNRVFALILSHGREQKYWIFQTDEAGKIEGEVTFPPDWPLGASELEWKEIER